MGEPWVKLQCEEAQVPGWALRQEHLLGTIDILHVRCHLLLPAAHARPRHSLYVSHPGHMTANDHPKKKRSPKKEKLKGQ